MIISLRKHLLLKEFEDARREYNDKKRCIDERCNSSECYPFQRAIEIHNLRNRYVIVFQDILSQYKEVVNEQ